MPCNIILGTQVENLAYFMTSCTPSSSGEVSYTLIGETQFQDTFQITGIDTQGNTFSEEIVLSKIQVRDYNNGIAGDVNPAKVFKLVIKVLKEVLCPECV